MGACGAIKSYHAGGGEGLEAFFGNVGGTVQGCWDDAGKIDIGDGWEREVFRQTREAYGVVDMRGEIRRRQECWF